MDEQNANQENELVDLEPNGEVKGGGVTGTGVLTLGGATSTTATQGRGIFTIATDRIGP